MGTFGVILLVIIVLVAYVVFLYNRLVRLRNQTDNAWEALTLLALSALSVLPGMGAQDVLVALIALGVGLAATSRIITRAIKGRLQRAEAALDARVEMFELHGEGGTDTGEGDSTTPYRKLDAAS